jgi:hypothetical protein
MTRFLRMGRLTSGPGSRRGQQGQPPAAARPALVDGEPGAVWAVDGRPRVVFGFVITQGKIASIELIADPGRLSELDLVILDE